MTHPTTDPTQSIRERLARAHFAKFEEIRRRAAHEPRAWEDDDVVRSGHFDLVDAILAELQEPSEGMYQAAEMEVGIWQIWQAMIQHIRGGGK